jgi:hypothetical protein
LRGYIRELEAKVERLRRERSTEHIDALIAKSQLHTYRQLHAGEFDFEPFEEAKEEDREWKGESSSECCGYSYDSEANERDIGVTVGVGTKVVLSRLPPDWGAEELDVYLKKDSALINFVGFRDGEQMAAVFTNSLEEAKGFVERHHLSVVEGRLLHAKLAAMEESEVDGEDEGFEERARDEPEPDAKGHVFQVNDVVEIKDLTSPQGILLNGRSGVVAAPINNKGRVLVDVGGEKVLVKVDNLLLLGIACTSP